MNAVVKLLEEQNVSQIVGIFKEEKIKDLTTILRNIPTLFGIGKLASKMQPQISRLFPSDFFSRIVKAIEHVRITQCSIYRRRVNDNGLTN